jgi:hypothetical protein
MEAAALASKIARGLALRIRLRLGQRRARTGRGDEGRQFGRFAVPWGLFGLAVAALGSVAAEAALIAAIAAVLIRLALIIGPLGVAVLVRPILI